MLIPEAQVTSLSSLMSLRTLQFSHVKFFLSQNVITDFKKS